MIRLTRMNHTPVVLNSDLIEHMESTPDTVITMATGQKVVVLEPADEVVRRVMQFRRDIGNPAVHYGPGAARAAAEGSD
jgi:flagellar protein FlbD